MTEPKAQVLSAGRAAFSALAPRAGFPSEGWQAVVLSARREGTGARGVLRFDRDGFAPLIVKLRLPVDAARSEAARAAHALAAHNLPCGTVQLLAAAPDHGALLLSHVPGRTAWEVLSQTEDSAERIPRVTRIGCMARGIPFGWRRFDRRRGETVCAAVGPTGANRTAIAASAPFGPPKGYSTGRTICALPCCPVTLGRRDRGAENPRCRDPWRHDLEQPACGGGYRDRH